MTYKLEELAELIIHNASKKYFTLPPALKYKKHLIDFLKFTSDYYNKEKNITLKEAIRYIPYIKITQSKIHQWLHVILYAIRISLIIDKKTDVSVFLINEIPEAPLVLKNALEKYKYIVISSPDKDQIDKCVEKETTFFNINGSFPAFLSNKFEQHSIKDEILLQLKNLIDVSEVLDQAGNFKLSEKILNSTEILAESLGKHYEI